MASYQTLRNGKIRAQLCVNRKRVTACFETRQQAEAWATLQEAALGRQPEALVHKLPPRVLSALAGIEYSHADIVSSATPFDGSSGVYFLIRQGEVVYVGKSIDVFTRIGRHRREGGAWFDSFNVIRCPVERLPELEERYILAFMPMMNTALTYKKPQAFPGDFVSGKGRRRAQRVSHQVHTTKIDDSQVVVT
jgi:hypothetical protein